MNSDTQLKYAYWIVLAAVSITYLSGINLPIVGVDASQYASISMEMSKNGGYLEVVHRGRDYLDKPPLLFWLSSLSFNIFGLENWAYRLPSLLFIYLGIYSTMRLGRLLYHKSVGYIAAIIFATTEAIFVISHDVRTDTILVSSVIFSVWSIIEFLKKEKRKYLILGFIGIGCAMLSKGPVGLMVPVLALSTHFVIKKQWKNFLRWEWILGIFIVAVIISPMAYGLYTQFDAQTGKTTTLSSGKLVEGISGLKFYFWDQSFGRITGESEWNNNAPWHFFLGTFSWSFLPWTLIALFGIWYKLKSSFKAIEVSEFYTIGAIFLPFIGLSMSKFKLDHYIFIIYPFVAILCGNFLIQLAEKRGKTGIAYMQLFVSALLLTSIFLIGNFVFDQVNFIYWAVIVAISVLIIAIIIKRRSIIATVFITAVIAALFNIFLKNHFYYELAQYDGQYIAAQHTLKHGIPSDKQHVIKISPHCYDFYTRSISPYRGKLGHLEKTALGGTSLLLKQEQYDSLDLKQLGPKKVYKIKHHSTTMLNMKFLNSSTRKDAIQYIYLIVF
jgi:4-amino-4-deoxy-L-arabinose transferase-like glycosyltransferase